MNLITNTILEEITTEETAKNYFYAKVKDIIKQKQRKPNQDFTERIINLYQDVSLNPISSNVNNQKLLGTIGDLVLEILNSKNSNELEEQGVLPELLGFKKVLSKYYSAKIMVEAIKKREVFVQNTFESIMDNYAIQAINLIKALHQNPLFKYSSLLHKEIVYLENQLEYMNINTQEAMLNKLLMSNETDLHFNLHLNGKELLEQLDPNQAFQEIYKKQKNKLKNIIIKNIRMNIDYEFCKSLQEKVPYIAFELPESDKKYFKKRRNVVSTEKRLLNLRLANLMLFLSNNQDKEFILRRTNKPRISAPIAIYNRTALGYIKKRFTDAYLEIGFGKGYEVFLKLNDGRERFVQEIYYPETIIGIISLRNKHNSYLGAIKEVLSSLQKT